MKLNGWAVESRVYAEDPYRNFLPSTGRLTRYRPPAERVSDGVTVRNDTGVYEGGEISLYYDPMIAKLVTHARTREAAIDAQADALDAFVIDGIRHNIPFLSALMAHKRWRAGKLSTGLHRRGIPRRLSCAARRRASAAQVLAAVAAAIDHVLGERKRRISGQIEGKQRHPRKPPRGLARRAGIHSSRSGARTAPSRCAFPGKGKGGAAPSTSDWKPGDPLWTGTIDSQPVAVQVRPIPNGFALSYRGVETKAYVYTEREAGYARLMPAKKAADTGKQVLCPMPGLVVSIAVKEGQEVKAGETVAVVEAMKMENVLRAEIDGTVKKIHAKPGDSLAVDAVILEFA